MRQGLGIMQFPWKMAVERVVIKVACPAKGSCRSAECFYKATLLVDFLEYVDIYLLALFMTKGSISIFLKFG